MIDRDFLGSISICRLHAFLLINLVQIESWPNECFEILEDDPQVAHIPYYWEFYLEILVSLNFQRRALFEIRNTIIKKPMNPWLQIAWKKLPNILNKLGYQRIHWSPEMNPKKLVEALSKAPIFKDSAIVP